MRAFRSRSRVLILCLLCVSVFVPAFLLSYRLTLNSSDASEDFVEDLSVIKHRSEAQTISAIEQEGEGVKGPPLVLYKDDTPDSAVKHISIANVDEARNAANDAVSSENNATKHDMNGSGQQRRQEELAVSGARVDEYSRTSVPSIWAVGDVTDRINLTPVALMEGGALARTLFANEPTKPDYSAVSSAAFSQPPIGQVGLTEEQAIDDYGDIDVYTSNFRPLKATLSGLPDRVFMKLIVCAQRQTKFWVSMCVEMTRQKLSSCCKSWADFDATVGIHPTASEELVTMRIPTRKIRSTPPPSEVKPDLDIKAAPDV